MKKWTILIGIFAVFFIGGYFWLTYYAVKIIQPSLRKAVGAGFIVGKVNPQITCLSAREVRYEDPLSKQRFFQIEEVRIYPSLFSLFKKSVSINEVRLIQPTFFFSRSPEGDAIFPWLTMKEETEAEGGERELSGKINRKNGISIPVQIGRIRIRKGTIEYEDQRMGDPPARIKLEELNIEIGKISYPFCSSHSPIELKGKIKREKHEGRLEARGWFDLKTMDMEISLRGREIELDTFEPYYRKRVSAKIVSGSIDVDSRMTIVDKKMEVSGELGLINFHLQKGGGTFFWIPAGILIPILEQRRGETKIPFHVKGDLKDPRFNPQEALLIRIAVSFLKALGFPVQNTEGSA